MIKVLGSLGTVITAVTPRTSEAFGKDMHCPALHELVEAEPIRNLPIHPLDRCLLRFGRAQKTTSFSSELIKRRSLMGPPVR